MLRQMLAAAAFASLAAITTLAHAQGFGGSSAFGRSGGGFGSTGLGSSGFGSSGLGSSGFGSSGLGGLGSSGFGNSGLGSSGFGGMGSGMNGMNGGFGNSGMGGNAAFGNQGLGGGQNFVGRDSTDMATVWNQMGRAGTQFFNQLGRNVNRNANRGNNSNVEAVENIPQQVRIRMQVAFDAPAPDAAQLTTTIRERVGRVLAIQGMAAPEINMDGDVAVLRGVALTESQRLVLEKLVMLEPGVREVRNEMTVAEPSASGLAPASN